MTPIPLTTRILLADDHLLVRNGLKLILETVPDLSVVAEAGDGAEALRLAIKEEVHLAVLDVSMPRAPSRDQAQRELAIYLKTWQAMHPGAYARIVGEGRDEAS